MPGRASERAAGSVPPGRCCLVCGAPLAAHKRPRIAANPPQACAQRPVDRFGGKFEAEGWLRGARRQSRCAGALLGTWMEDTGGKSGRRPGSHLQVEASGLGNATSVQQRLAGRSRRGEVVEGCAGGAEGRSKRLICPRGTWMEDTGGKSARRPGRHLQVEASGPGNARPAHWRLAGRLRRGKVTEGCAGGAAGRSKGLTCLRVT